MATPRKANAIDWIAMVLLIIGGINWGLIGLFGFNLVSAIFGETVLAAIVYILVGVSALWAIYTATKLPSGSSAREAPVAHRTTGYSGPERRRVNAPYAGPDRRMATY